MIVTEVRTVELKQTTQYNSNTNRAIIIITSNVKFTDSKVTPGSGWVLSGDGLTYSKEYTENTNYSTTFKLVDGTSKAFTISLTQIK
ncbi:hypothetical protein D3C72_2009990 [compost metagenome]